MKILFIQFILLLLSCEEQSKPEYFFYDMYGPQKQIDEKYFNVKFTDLYGSTSGKYTWDYASDINDGENYKIYSKSQNYHVFMDSIHTDYLEIQYACSRYFYYNPKLNTLYENIKCLIGSCNGNTGISKCFYIFWLNNRHEDTTIKLSRKIYIRDWGIGVHTDSIYTNIEREEIYRLFPEFKGKVIDGEISEIVVNDEFSITDHWFYKEIEFVGFNRFRDDYRIFKDSLKQLGINWPKESLELADSLK
jgi:hypothetical protein